MVLVNIQTPITFRNDGSCESTAKKNFQLTQTDSFSNNVRSKISSENRKKWFASPRFAITIGLLEIGVLVYVMAYLKVIEGQFFRFGPPIQLFQYTITGNKEFAGILLFLFIHQLVYTWLNEVVNPWMINEVQDPNVKRISFSKPQTIFFINMYYLYFALNGVLIVNVSLSQLSFLIVMVLADFVASTALNVHYIWHKMGPYDAECSDETCSDESFPMVENV